MMADSRASRCVLENVPRIHFFEGGKFCPEDICFPSALKSCLEFLGDPIGCKHTCPPTVGLACCGYSYLVGTTGEAFALSWSPDWEFSSAIREIAATAGGAPYRRALDSVGYAYEYVTKEPGRDCEAIFCERIRCLRTFCHRFEPGPDVDLVEVSHNGYAFLDQPVFHLRRVIWFKPGLWLVDDVLTGLGSHAYHLSFNFPPRALEADARVPDAYVYRGERIKVRLLPMLREGISSRVFSGSTEPKGGWVSYGYAVKVPAPQLIYTRVGPAPTRFMTAILQEGAGEVRQEDVGAAPGAAAVLVVSSGGKSWRVTLGGEAQGWTVSWAPTA